LEKQERAQAVAESLEWLPEIQQEVVRMRFFHDLKLQEISELMDIPLSIVKSHLYGALRKLKRVLVKREEIHLTEYREPEKKQEREVLQHETFH